MAFNTLAAHRIPTLCLYKHLLRTARQFTDNVQATFLYYTVRERFRFHRHDTSPTQTKRNLEVAEEWLERMRRALQGEEADNKIIENLAWGREGRLKDVLARVSDGLQFRTCTFVRVLAIFPSTVFCILSWTVQEQS